MMINLQATGKTRLTNQQTLLSNYRLQLMD